jgi:phosphomannomutase
MKTEIQNENNISTLKTAKKLVELRNILNETVQKSEKMMANFLKGQVKEGKIRTEKAKSQLVNSHHFLKEWLDAENNIPQYIIEGIYKAMLENRSADILFCFSSGWREFGTAGIRNPAVQSSFPAIQEQELREFAKTPFSPILTGPNLINTVTLLQQESAIVRIMRDLQDKIHYPNKIHNEDDPIKVIDKEFKENIVRNRVTIAYDSRLNGEYFAKLLASAFLHDKIDVDLFDNAAGVPHLAWATNREGSAFGFLISASHSEANYNGFKVFLGHQMSQVDKNSKDMIVKARDNVRYKDMNLDLARETADIDSILRKNGKLRWIGGDKKKDGKEYYGRELVSFYPWYYDMVKARSPLAMLDDNIRKDIEQRKKEDPLHILYTAFFGVGAVPAADFRRFLRDECDYNEVDIVKAQTEVMDGMFPGHISPDPGIQQGWVSNFIDYIRQYAGNDLANIEDAIIALNKIDVGIATDPDIDRAGMMISLPAGTNGNIKKALMDALMQYLATDDNITKDKNTVTKHIQEKLNDKFLLTANDAWAFMIYWKLKMLEDDNRLEKDKLYIILKSHVTTPAIERIAKIYRDKGYLVYVVDTYVGFTEIGKKGRDLFKIAKLSWDIYSLLEETDPLETRKKISDLVVDYKKANDELNSNVPSETAGLFIVEKVIELLENFIKGDIAKINQIKELLNVLSRIHILAGVEESNGYGELGCWNRENQKVEQNHISDKDGSMAAYEFLEILSYGRCMGKTAYEMYQEPFMEIGMVHTVNSALYHPGLTGVEEKTYEIEALEKIFAYALLDMLDAGVEVKLFNGRYRLTNVAIYRDRKYDSVYLGFPEEGVKLYFQTSKCCEVSVMYRPSGTGDSNRVYIWLLGVKPKSETDFEEYRREIEEEMQITVKDFYGIEEKDTGYVELKQDEFYGLLKALKDGGLNSQREVLGKVLGKDKIEFTEEEDELYQAVRIYANTARKGNKDVTKLEEDQQKNREAWEKYLNSKKVAKVKNKLPFIVDGKIVAEIPRSAMIAWQAGLVAYLNSLLSEKISAGVQFSFPNPEIMEILRGM